MNHAIERQYRMNRSKVIVATCLLISASLMIWASGVFAEQLRPKPSAKVHQLSEADARAIWNIIKGQETAWNKHDVKAFYQVVPGRCGGDQRCRGVLARKDGDFVPLTAYHNTIFNELEEKLEEVNVHTNSDVYAVAVSIWQVGSFKAPSGVEVPACRHRSTLVLAKGRMAGRWSTFTTR